MVSLVVPFGRETAYMFTQIVKMSCWKAAKVSKIFLVMYIEVISNFSQIIYVPNLQLHVMENVVYI